MTRARRVSPRLNGTRSRISSKAMLGDEQSRNMLPALQPASSTEQQWEPEHVQRAC
jgi:hypothetical protein